MCNLNQYTERGNKLSICLVFFIMILDFKTHPHLLSDSQKRKCAGDQTSNNSSNQSNTTFMFQNVQHISSHSIGLIIDSMNAISSFVSLYLA